MSAMFSFLRAALALAAFAQLHAQIQIPNFPTRYTVAVSFNSISQGYTQEYIEYYDDSKNMSRFDGVRASDDDGIDVVDYSQHTLTSYSASSSSGSSCLIYNVSRYIMRVADTSYGLLTYVSQSDFAYVETTSQVRNISCNHFQTTTAFGRNSNLVVDLYFSVANNLPVRMMLNGTMGRYNSSRQFTTTLLIDWVNWVVADQDFETFETPAGCTYAPAGQFPSRLTPLNNTVVPGLLPADTPLPSFPTDFSILLEGKVTMGSRPPFVIAVDWDLDSTLPAESNQFFRSGSFGDQNLFIFRYDQNVSFEINGGDYDTTDTCRQFHNGNGETISYLASAGDGMIYKLFVPTSFTPTIYQTFYNYDSSLAVYMGQDLVRGVMADYWKIPNINTLGGRQFSTNFTFDLYIYFYPQGWQFPGRHAIGTNAAVPIRIITTGTAVNATTSNPYYALWDIFQFSPAKPDPSDLDYTEYGCVNLPANPVPVIPTQYSVVLSANFIENGFTLAYKEYYDSQQKRFRSDGQFETQNIVDILDLETHVMTSYTPTNGSASCLFYDITNERNQYIGPSVYYLQNLNFTTMTYLGVSYAARNIPCVHFQISETFSYNERTINETIDYYFDVRTLLPVRVSIVGYDVTDGQTDNSFTGYYDWLQWVVAPQDPKLFAVPTYCVGTTDGLPRLEFPENSTVSKNLLPSNAAFPSLPTQFSMILEGKIDLSATDYFDAVYALSWSLAQGAERFDIGLHNDHTLSFLYDYAGGFVYQNPNVYGAEACQTAPTTTQTKNFLADVRAGYINKLFQPNQNSFVQNGAYGGQSSVRGVSADYWVIPNIIDYNNDNIYSFSMTVYFFPLGWQFPGRTSVQTDQSIPMRVVCNGTVFNGYESTPYTDQWDIFLVYPQAPPASTLTPSAINCNAIPPPLTTSTTGSNNPIVKLADKVSPGGVAAIVIIVVLVVVGAIVLSVVYVRRKREGRTLFGGFRPAQP